MLHILVVVDRSNLEMLLSHEAIKTNKEKNKKISKHMLNDINTNPRSNTKIAASQAKTISRVVTDNSESNEFWLFILKR